MLIDKEVLVGFIEEASSYLPAIRAGLAAYQADPTAMDGLEQAYRHAHTIKGASSMVGLTGLSHVAYYIEEILEAIGAGQLIMAEETIIWLDQTLTQVEMYLDSALGDTPDEAALLAGVGDGYHHLRGEQPDETEPEFTTDPFESEEELLLSDFDDPMFDEMDMFDDEMSAELMEAFYLEAEDHLRLISLSLAGLEKDPDQKDLLQQVRRSAHTLKGASGTVGLRQMADLTHRMEDMLDQLYEGTMTINSDIMTLLLASNDALEDLIGNHGESDTIPETLEELYAGYDILLNSDFGIEAQTQPVIAPLGEDNIIDLATLELHLQPDAETEAETEPAQAESDSPAPDAPKPDERVRPESGELVRVPIKRLDELIRLVGELVITRTAFEQRMGNLIREVAELRPSIDRLRRVSTRLDTEYEASALGGNMGGLIPLPEGQIVKHNGGTTAPPGDSLTNLVTDSLTQSVTDSLTESVTAQTHDFDELEFDRYTEFHLMSRELAETTSDVNTVGNALTTLIDDFDSILTRQSRLSSELQEKLMRTRMVSLATLATRLHRTVRVVARRQDKAADLILEGDQLELDKTVLEEIADPLLHLLRNAVDHGLEPPALRQALGKPERGQIHLRAYNEGNQVVIEVADDGAGLDAERIRAKAVSGGYVSEVEAPHLSPEALYTLPFMPGFSTAGEVSEVSGRGVGLDVVKANVNRLKGTVTLTSKPGQGATFTIRLPMTLAVTRALLVKAHNETFALPLNAVNQILRLEHDQFDRVGQESVVRVGQHIYPILRLGEALRLKQPAAEKLKRLPVLIINAAGQEVALLVDQIVQGREVVIKTLGHHLRRVHGIMGATLMGDGSVVLILNPAELASKPIEPDLPAWTPPHPAPARVHDIWNIMVVDDAVSVRRVVSNMVKNAGWQPTMAKDGQEALEIIQRSAQLPDLILLDIEMPRMDGYELTAILQSQAAYRGIPIVMLTSRAGEKHRRKALDLGVSDYITKPYQAEQLLTIVRRLVRERQGVAS